MRISNNVEAVTEASSRSEQAISEISKSSEEMAKTVDGFRKKSLVAFG